MRSCGVCPAVLAGHPVPDPPVGILDQLGQDPGRHRVTVGICPRGVPIALIGTAGGALALWADAPVETAVPVALLIVLDIRVRRRRRRT